MDETNVSEVLSILQISIQVWIEQSRVRIWMCPQNLGQAHVSKSDRLS